MTKAMLGEALILVTAFASIVGQDIAQDTINPLTNLNNVHVYDWQDLAKIGVSVVITIISRFAYTWIENYFKQKKSRKTNEKN